MRTLRTACTGAVALALMLASAAPTAAQEAEAEAWSARTTPIEGTLVGVDWIDPEAPGCAPGSSWRFHSEGTGQIAGVGTVDFVLTQCSVFGEETPTGTFGDGTITFTTADGDTLEIAQTGHAEGVPGPDGLIGWTMGGSWRAVGGTGRFDGASGYGWIGGLGDVGQGVPDALYSFRGNIEYGTAASAEPAPPAEVTITVSDGPEVPGQPEQVCPTSSGGPETCTWTSSDLFSATDPRLSGTATKRVTEYSWEAPLGGHIFEAIAIRIVNDQGAWVGTGRYVGSHDLDLLTYTLTGEEAYEGLTAFLTDPQLETDEEVLTGVIVHGEMPPFPESPIE